MPLVSQRLITITSIPLGEAKVPRPAGFKQMVQFEFCNGNGIVHEFAACWSSLGLRLF